MEPLPGLLRGRFSIRLPRRLPVHLRQVRDRNDTSYRASGCGLPEGKRAGIATELAALVQPIVGGTCPSGYAPGTGSEAGPDQTGSQASAVAILRSPDALRRLLWSPGELGLAQAYVTGELDVEGDLKTAFSNVWSTVRERGVSKRRLSAAAARHAIATARRLGVIGRRLPAPESQAKLSGRLHTRLRDRSAIAHHYDLSNDFYALILGPEDGVLVRLLDVGFRRLHARRCPARQVRAGCPQARSPAWATPADVGCGWGSMSLHAAANYGVSVTGVTLSREQQAFASQRAKHEGLAERVDIRLQDYRDVSDGPYDAVVSLEMGEHVGQDNYPVYASQLFRQLRPEGRLVLQQMSRHDSHPGGVPSSSPTSRPTCTCDRSARPSTCSRAPASKSVTCMRSASTTYARLRPGTRPSSSGGTRQSPWWVKRSHASGGSTSSAGRLPSRRAGWSGPDPGRQAGHRRRELDARDAYRLRGG